MQIMLSPLELSALLGARLMYVGVPFTRTSKPALTLYQQELLNAAWERLIQQRDTQRNSLDPTPSNQINKNLLAWESTREELGIYIQVFKSCLKECSGDKVELELQLGSRDEKEMEQLTHKLDLLLTTL